MIRYLISRFPYVFWVLLCFALYTPAALFVDSSLFGWGTWRFWQLIEIHFWTALWTCPLVAFAAACTPTKGWHP